MEGIAIAKSSSQYLKSLHNVEKNKIFAKEFAELKKELATLNEKTTKDIHEISDNYRCELS